MRHRTEKEGKEGRGGELTEEKEVGIEDLLYFYFFLVWQKIPTRPAQGNRFTLVTTSLCLSIPKEV